MATSPTSLEMGLVVTLHRVPLRAPLTHPLLATTMLPSIVFLDSDEVTEGVARVVVQATGFRANKHSLLHDLASAPAGPRGGRGGLPLQSLPGDFMPAAVHLEVLLALEALVADFADVAVGLEEGARGEGDHLGVGVRGAGGPPLLLLEDNGGVMKS